MPLLFDSFLPSRSATWPSTMQLLKGWGSSRSPKTRVESQSIEWNQPRVWSIASEMKSAGKLFSNSSRPRWG